MSMDFHLKQWRGDHQHESDSDQQQQPSDVTAKLPRLLLFDPYQHQHQHQSSSSELSLFTPESTTTNTKLSTTTNLSVDSTTRSSRMGGSCCFSMAQWQELEVQALIYRHMIAGATIPPELLHLVKKSLILSSHSSPYYHLSHPLHHYSPYQPALLQSGYWGRGNMDPEPGRCRRTDGKKWRCSRDVVGGHKYCERHIHRGRNRSRKPVEIPTPNPTPTSGVGALSNNNNSNSGAGVLMKTNAANPTGAAQPLAALGRGDGGGGVNRFGLSGPSSAFDLHFNQRPSESITETKGLFITHNELAEDDDKSGGRILRRFFDDWPGSIQESENAITNASPGTSLSISGPGNPSSDFSLKLSTGGRDFQGPEGRNVGREQHHQLNWGGSASTWSSNHMGGPLAEALRSSSTTTTSPTSVLHQLRGEASFVST